VISRQNLLEISEAIVNENRRRAETGAPPLMLLYDQVYWQLTYGESEHYNPVTLVPEMARYTLFVDAISKSWAATGLRMGWAVVPPWVRNSMKAYIGHMGAWASRSVQLATARVLDDPDRIKPFLNEFKEAIETRLMALYNGFQAMKADGLPVHAMAPEGAIYLTVRFDLQGRTWNQTAIDSDEAMRSALLHGAGTAVVPFTAFGYPDGSGWVRFSVGAVGLDDVSSSLDRIRALLTAIRDEN